MLRQALIDELNAHGPRLPVYWGNRNWHPLLGETIAKMACDRVRHALAFVTSAFSFLLRAAGNTWKTSSRLGSCRPRCAPRSTSFAFFTTIPGFIEHDGVSVRRRPWSKCRPTAARTPVLVFTAHSIPWRWRRAAGTNRSWRGLPAGCPARWGVPSGRSFTKAAAVRPAQPWLEPDICGYLEQLGQKGAVRDVVIVPIGFLSEHMEVVYDLDVEARAVCGRFGIAMVRSHAGRDPSAVSWG